MTSNFVTHDTAVMLRDAGFPQPEFDLGQIWYDVNGYAWAIGLHYTSKQGLLPYSNTLDSRTEPKRLITHNYALIGSETGFVYAPTATDILRELGGEYTLCSFKISKIQWEVERRMPEPFNTLPMTWVNENPAEAAAQAFLNKQK